MKYCQQRASDSNSCCQDLQFKWSNPTTSHLVQGMSSIAALRRQQQGLSMCEDCELTSGWRCCALAHRGRALRHPAGCAREPPRDPVPQGLCWRRAPRPWACKGPHHPQSLPESARTCASASASLPKPLTGPALHARAIGGKIFAKVIPG